MLQQYLEAEGLETRTSVVVTAVQKDDKEFIVNVNVAGKPYIYRADAL